MASCWACQMAKPMRIGPTSLRKGSRQNLARCASARGQGDRFHRIRRASRSLRRIEHGSRLPPRTWLLPRHVSPAGTRADLAPAAASSRGCASPRAQGECYAKSGVGDSSPPPRSDGTSKSASTAPSAHLVGAASVAWSVIARTKSSSPIIREGPHVECCRFQLG
jgi:hypothetical protein